MAKAIFLFKNKNELNRNGMKLYWNGQSSKAPSSSVVYLQVYDTDLTTWDTVASNSVANADTDFNLTYTIIPADLSKYEDVDGWVSCRVYQ